MKIRIRTKSFKFSMPVPLSLAGGVIRMIPDVAFREMRKDVPPPYDELICKETVLQFYLACKEELMQYQGLEIIHVEARDGTFVSIIL